MVNIYHNYKEGYYAFIAHDPTLAIKTDTLSGAVTLYGLHYNELFKGKVYNVAMVPSNLSKAIKNSYGED